MKTAKPTASERSDTDFANLATGFSGHVPSSDATLATGLAQPTPIRVSYDPSEPRSEYLLRIAAAIITSCCPQAPVIMEFFDEESIIDAELTATAINEELAEISRERQELAASMRFTARITQAGGEGADPTVTLTTTKEELKRCPTIPFYRRAAITITPLP